jgi:hypothetical protein
MGPIVGNAVTAGIKCGMSRAVLTRTIKKIRSSMAIAGNVRRRRVLAAMPKLSAKKKMVAATMPS